MAISKIQSWEGFKFTRFLWGRVRNLILNKDYKRAFLVAVVSVCGYFTVNQELTGLLAGPIAEAVWGLAEFYYKKVKI